MKKMISEPVTLSFFKLGLVTVLGFGIAGAAPNKSNDPRANNITSTQQPAYEHPSFSEMSETRKLFLKYMDPKQPNYLGMPMSEVFRALQLESFSTPIDTMVRDYFSSSNDLNRSSSKVLNEIFRLFEVSMSESLDLFVHSYNIDKFKIEDSSQISINKIKDASTDQKNKGNGDQIGDKVYSKLNKIIKTVAVDLGFSADSILERLIYINQAGGELNAFTVSGSQRQIIAVINAELLNKMSEQEIRAIVAHEFTHIRAGHPLNGYALSIMNRLLFNALTSDDSGLAENQQALKKDRPKNDNKKINYLRNLDVNLLSEIHNDSHDHILDMMSAQITKGKTFLSDSSVQQDLTNIIEKVMNNDVERFEFLNSYLDLAIKIFEESAKAPDALAYFKNLKEILSKKQLVKDPEQFKKYMKILDNTISQAQETTADHGGSSAAKNLHMASAINKLMTGKEYKGDQSAKFFVETSNAQYLRDREKMTQELYNQITREGSHPHSKPRIYAAYTLSSIPQIFFASPMYRLATFQAVLTEAHLNPEAWAESLSAEEIQQSRDKLDLFNKDLSKLILKMEERIKTNMDLDKMRKINTNIDNPRLNNLMQFILYRKIELFNELAASTNANDKILIERSLNVLGAGIFAQLKVDYNNLLQRSQWSDGTQLSDEKKASITRRLEMIEEASLIPQKKSDLLSLRELSIRVTNLPGNRTKGSRIPIGAGACSLLFN